jgi:hypothetical protein
MNEFKFGGETKTSPLIFAALSRKVGAKPKNDSNFQFLKRRRRSLQQRHSIVDTFESVEVGNIAASDELDSFGKFPN